MTKLRKLSLYFDAYQPTQLRTLRLAREWMEAGIEAKQATEWADAGFLPEEAVPLIASGMTVELAIAADPKTEQERMEYLADRMRMLGN